MIVFASLDGPPVSMFELGIKTTEEHFTEQPMRFGVSEDLIDSFRSLTPIFPAAAGIICIAIISAQFVRMKVSSGNSKITV
jgi:hypothetical protein